MTAQAPEMSAPTDVLLLGTNGTEHPLIPMPFTAEIDGRQFKGDGLSLVGAEVSGLVDPAIEGAVRLVRLSFVFHGFAVVIPVECKITTTSASTGKVSLVFTDPAGAHLPQLRHVLNSYVAGDLVSMGQFLSVAAATPPTKKAAGSAEAATAGERIRRVLGTLALAALTLVLVGAALTLAYRRLYIVPVAAPAQIMPQGQMLGALAAGQLDYVNPDAAKGEVAYAIRSVSGQVLSVAMPCTCTGILTGPSAGDTIKAGQPVMLVHTEDAPILVHAAIPSEDLFKLAGADHLSVELGDGTKFTARLAAPLVTAPNAEEGESVKVMFTPDSPIDPARIGQIANVEIVKPVPRQLLPLVNFADRFGG